MIDIYNELRQFGLEVDVYDPWANPDEVVHEYNLSTTRTIPGETFDAVVLGVAHREFLSLDIDAIRNENSILYDVKGILKNNVDGKL